ncbi:MAG: DUF2442 domain-containing protein [Myxococcales bacterium]
MIKIVKATYVRDRVVALSFSDGAVGEYDFGRLHERRTSLTQSWDNLEYFRLFFIELGAIGWPNGLELSPQALHRTLADGGLLRYPQRVA